MRGATFTAEKVSEAWIDCQAKNRNKIKRFELYFSFSGEVMVRGVKATRWGAENTAGPNRGLAQNAIARAASKQSSKVRAIHSDTVAG